MVRNDDFYLRKWVEYYGRELGGKENLYIYFDGLDQERAPFCEGTHAERVPKIGTQVVSAEKGRLGGGEIRKARPDLGVAEVGIGSLFVGKERRVDIKHVERGVFFVRFGDEPAIRSGDVQRGEENRGAPEEGAEDGFFQHEESSL